MSMYDPSFQTLLQRERRLFYRVTDLRAPS